MSILCLSQVPDRPWPMVALLPLLGVIILLWLSAPGHGEVVPSDMVIAQGETETVANKTLELHGNVTVEGTLIVDNATLRFDAVNLSLRVRSGGSLQLIDSHVTAQNDRRFQALIFGEMIATDTTLSDYKSLWMVGDGGSLEWQGVILDGNNTSWGISSRNAAKLELTGTTFNNMTQSAMATIGNEGQVADSTFNLAPGAVRRQYYFPSRLKIVPDTGLDLSSSYVQIRNSTGKLINQTLWQDGELEMGLLGRIVTDDGTEVVNGPFHLAVNWPLVSESLAQQYDDPGYTWGEARWEEALSWSAEGSLELTTINLHQVTMNFPISATLLTPDLEKWDELAVKVVVNNPNPIYVERIRVHLIYETNTLDFETVNGIQPGGNSSVILNWTISNDGDLDLKVVADPDGELTQWTDRWENEQTVNINIKGRDTHDDDPTPWRIAIMVLLCLAGLMIYAVVTNLKLEGGLQPAEDPLSKDKFSTTEDGMSEDRPDLGPNHADAKREPGTPRDEPVDEPEMGSE